MVGEAAACPVETAIDEFRAIRAVLRLASEILQGAKGGETCAETRFRRQRLGIACERGAKASVLSLQGAQQRDRLVLLFVALAAGRASAEDAAQNGQESLHGSSLQTRRIRRV